MNKNQHKMNLNMNSSTVFKQIKTSAEQLSPNEKRLMNARIKGAINHLHAKGYSAESIKKFVEGHKRRSFRLRSVAAQ